MTVKEGLNVGEQVVDSARAAYLVQSRVSYGFTEEQWLNGELVLTQAGVVFLEAKGLFGQGRSRHHSVTYDAIAGVRTESRGIVGYLTGQKFLSLDVITHAGQRTFRYSCSNSDAARLCDRIMGMLQRRNAKESLRRELVRLIKPMGEVSLSEIARMPSVKNIVRQMLGRPPLGIPEDRLLAIVTDEVRSLISMGRLDGIIDDEGNFISTLVLSRRSVQYQVTIDFPTLFAQLQNKGMILQTIECPSCGGKLDYPKEGSMVKCQYCGALVSAVDVFERFKRLIDI